MLEDVPGLINPIIHAMVESQQRNQQGLDRAQRADQLKQEASYKQAELKHQDAQLAELERQHDQTMQYNRDMMTKVHIPQLQALMENQGMENKVRKLQILQGGGKVNPTTGDVDLPGSSEEAQAADAHLKQLIAQSQAQGTEQGKAQAALGPEGSEVFKRSKQADLDKQQRLFDQQMQIEMAHGADARQLADINNKAAMSRTNVEQAGHLKGIMLLHSLGLEDGSGSASSKAKTIADGVFKGDVDPDKLSKDDKTLVTNYLAANGETLPTGQGYKKYQGALDSASRLQDIIRMGRDLATKYSIDSPGNTMKGNANFRTGIPGIGAVGGITPGSEASSAIENFGTQIGKLIPTLENSARQSDANIARQLLGNFDPKAPMVQNLKNINQTAASYGQILKAGTAGINPDRVNVALQQRGVTDFGGLSNSPSQYKVVKVSPDGTHQIGTNDNGKTWFDVAKGTQIGGNQ